MEEFTKRVGIPENVCGEQAHRGVLMPWHGYRFTISRHQLVAQELPSAACFLLSGLATVADVCRSQLRHSH